MTKTKNPGAIHVVHYAGMKRLDTFQNAVIEYMHGKDKYRLTVHYGMQYLPGNASPFFSLSGEVDHYGHGGWRSDSCGQIHDVIQKHFPDLYHALARWHLADQNGQPMHYVANAKWWADLIGGRREWGESDTDPLGALKKTIVYGAASEDWQILLIRLCKHPDAFEQYLYRRMPALKDAFLRAMEKHSVPLIPDDVIEKHFPHLYRKRAPAAPQGRP